MEMLPGLCLLFHIQSYRGLPEERHKWYDMLQLGGQVRVCLFAWVDACTMVCIQLCAT